MESHASVRIICCAASARGRRVTRITANESSGKNSVARAADCSGTRRNSNALQATDLLCSSSASSRFTYIASAGPRGRGPGLLGGVFVRRVASSARDKLANGVDRLDNWGIQRLATTAAQKRNAVACFRKARECATFPTGTQINRTNAWLCWGQVKREMGRQSFPVNDRANLRATNAG